MEIEEMPERRKGKKTRRVAKKKKP